MAAEEYDPLFPTDEDEDCVFVSASNPASGNVISNQKTKPLEVQFHNRDIIMPDLTAIPLPGDTVVEETTTVGDITKGVELPPVVQPPLASNLSESTSKQTPSKGNDTIQLPKDNRECEVKPPLNKIQMLIKQKAEQLKGATLAENKPSKIRNPGFTFNVGKAKVKPTSEKVKFSVIKLDKKVSMFNQDSDEEESLVLKTPPKVCSSTSISSSSAESPDKTINILSDKEVNTKQLSDSMVNVKTDISSQKGIQIAKSSPIKSHQPKQMSENPEKAALSISPKTSLQFGKLSPTKSKEMHDSREKRLPCLSPRQSIQFEKLLPTNSQEPANSDGRKSPDRSDETIAAKVLAKKIELEYKLMMKGSLPAITSEVPIVVSPTKLSNPLQNTQSEVDKVVTTSSLEDTQTRSIPSLSVADDVNTESIVSQSNESVSSVVQNEHVLLSNHQVNESYEADSTIPDENMTNQQTKSLELYSDNESIDDEAFSDKSVTAVPADTFHTNQQSQTVLYNAAMDANNENSAIVTSQSGTATDDVQPCPPSISTSSTEAKNSISQSESVDSHCANIEKDVSASVKGESTVLNDVSVPAPVLPPEKTPAPVAPPQTDVSELTAVAQQLFQALSERINPSKDSHTVEEKPQPASTSSTDHHQHKASKSQPRRSRSHSPSKERQSKSRRDRRSRSRSGGPRSRARRSRSRGRRSRSRDRSSYHSNRKYRRSRSKTRYSRSRRSHSRNRSRSSSRSRTKRATISTSPENRGYSRRRSLSGDRSKNNRDGRSSSKTRHVSPTSNSNSAAVGKLSSSSITNQVIADNLALMSSTQPTAKPTVLQYVLTTDGQICQIASQMPPNWTQPQTTHVIDGPPPPPPGVVPPPPPSAGPPPPPPPDLHIVPPQPHGMASLGYGINQMQHHVLAPPVPANFADYAQSGYSSYPPTSQHVEPPPMPYMGLPHGNVAPQEPRWNDPMAAQQPPVIPPLMPANDYPRPFPMQDVGARFFSRQRERGPPPAPPGFNDFAPKIRPRPTHPSAFTRSYNAAAVTNGSSSQAPETDMMDLVSNSTTVNMHVDEPQPSETKDDSFICANRESQLSVKPAERTNDQPVTQQPATKPRRKSRFDDPFPSAPTSTTSAMPAVSVSSELPTGDVNRTEENKNENQNIKPSTNSDEQNNRRRSSRIQSKETRTQCENKLRAEKEEQEAERRKFSEKTNKPEEETVDFVIENRCSKKSIDLPNRPDPQPSPSRSVPPLSTGVAPGKLKMRWLQASKWQEEHTPSAATTTSHADSSDLDISNTESQSEHGFVDVKPDTKPEEANKNKEPAYFDRIDDNIYLTGSKKSSKSQKEAKRMVCDCSTSEEDRANSITACGDDCLNRMLMIECSSRCPCGEYCTNKRFERHANADVDIFLTENKGHGLKALSSLPRGSFIREYVGEVLGCKEFKHRVKQYARDQHRHYYFMALNADEIIDATMKGNISRFINHSCDPNAETQKWTVNGKLRVGFFTTRNIEAGEELTFDYQFERYGKEAQKCYCGSSNCRGFIGGEKTQPLKSLIADTKPATLSASAKKKKEEAKRKLDYNFSDDMLSDEIEKLSSLGGLKRSEHVLQLSRLMVRAESIEHRSSLVETIVDTTNQNCLRLFLSYHGLSLLWSWMVDLPNVGCYELKLMIIDVLKRLPISNKNIIQETKVLNVVERMAKESKDRLDILKAEIKVKKERLDSLPVKTEPTDPPAVSPADPPAVSPADPPSDPPAHPPADVEVKKEPADEVLASGSADASIMEETPTGEKTTVKIEAKLADSCNAKDNVKDEENTMQLDDVNMDTTSDKALNDKTDDLPSEIHNAPSIVSNTANSASDLKQSSTAIVEPQAEVDRSNAVLERQPSDPATEDGKSNVDEDSQDDCLSQDGRGLCDTSLVEDLETQENEADYINHMVSTLDELLLSWSQLKESFKIPKKQENEERKRTVKEIDTSRHEESENRHDKRDYLRFKSGGKYERKRRRETSPEYKSGKRKEDPSVDPVQSRLSKLHRRKMFEEQVRAEEEQMAYEYEQQHKFELEQYQQQQYYEELMEQQQQQQLNADSFHGVYSQPQSVPPAYIPPQPQSHTYTAPQYNQPLPNNQHTQQVGFVQPAAPPVQSVSATPIVQNAIPTSQAQTVCYYTTPQGVVVQQIVQTTTPQPSNPSVIYMTTATSQPAGDDPPPPPADLTPKLPTDWRSATDAQGRTYYYHRITRQTQWDVPTGSEEIGAAMDVDTPPQSKKSKFKHKKTTMALADTSADTKKIKEIFKSSISVHIRTLLNGYMKSDCKVGKITKKDDYKFLAKKLTHAVLDKELKHCRHHEDLEVNENVKFKAKEFVKKYMAKSGSVYRREMEEK